MEPRSTVQTILVVDDDPASLNLAKTILEHDGHQVKTAGSATEAMTLVTVDFPDLFLLDALMPGISGFDLASVIKQDPRMKNIPVIMVTSLDDRSSRLRALEEGVEDILSKPVDQMELRMRVRNLLRLKRFSDFLDQHNRILEEEVTERTRDLKQSYREMIHTLTRAAEYKDEDTGCHIRRISDYTLALSRVLGKSGEFQDLITFSSPMHDIGKIGIPDHILLKPGPFTPAEWEIMKTHTILGAQIVESSMDSPYLMMGAEIAMTHHERFDGGGYPRGLAGTDIPISGRIMAVADVYDALRSKRPYKPALSHEQSMKILFSGDGRTHPAHFDPDVLSAFGSIHLEFDGIFNAYG